MYEWYPVHSPSTGRTLLQNTQESVLRQSRLEKLLQVMAYLAGAAIMGCYIFTWRPF